MANDVLGHIEGSNQAAKKKVGQWLYIGYLSPDNSAL